MCTGDMDGFMMFTLLAFVKQFRMESSSYLYKNEMLVMLDALAGYCIFQKTTDVNPTKIISP